MRLNQYIIENGACLFDKNGEHQCIAPAYMTTWLHFALVRATEVPILIYPLFKLKKLILLQIINLIT